MKSKPTYEELEIEIDLLKKKNEEFRLRYQSHEEGRINYYNTILNKMGDPVFVKDSESKFLIVNDAFCKIFNLARKDIIGRTLSEDVSPDEQEVFLKIDKQVLSDGIENINEESLTVRGAQTQIISTHKTRFIDSNGKTFLIGVIRDISQQKEAEIKLKKAKEKSEESDQLKSAFLANMSHEIRTPLNSILGFSSLLKRENLTDQKKDEYLELIDSGGKRLLNIISDIVDISKLETNQLSINSKAFNLNQLIDNIQRQFNIHEANKVGTINTIKALGDSNSIISSDESRLTQILSNLLENALKFTEKGIIEFGYEYNKETIQFFVRDTGTGIDPKYHKIIFDRFKQIENDFTKSGSGTGLGLSIVKSLTELLGGEIWVESEKGKGSTFYFTIPNKSKKLDIDQSKKTIDDIKIDLDQTILIAEDEFINFLYLKALFENYPFKLIHARNGQEAIKNIKNNNSISLILMDIKMPKINGIEATIKIREFNKSIPIIALTAYALAEDKQKVLDAGCNDYLPKPFDEKTLIEMVEKHSENLGTKIKTKLKQ